MREQTCILHEGKSAKECVTPKAFLHQGTKQAHLRVSIRVLRGRVAEDTRTVEGASNMCSSGFSGLGQMVAPDETPKLNKLSGMRESAAHVELDQSGVRESRARVGSDPPGVRKPEAPDHIGLTGDKKWAGVRGPWLPPSVRKDSFQWDPERSVLIRFHAKVRTFRFDPQKTVLPADVPLCRLTGNRRTYAMFTDGRQMIDEDDFFQPSSRKLSGDWTGRTEFEVQTNHA